MKRILRTTLFVNVIALTLLVARPASAQLAIKDLEIAGTAYDINNKGQIVGNVYTPGTSWYYAFLWTPPGGTVTLSGGIDSFGFGVNDIGQVVGRTYMWDVYADRAVLWQNGGMTNLGTLPGGQLSGAWSINSSGSVVGESQTTEGAVAPVLRLTHAFLWTQANGMTDLGTLPGGSDSVARGINDLGQVAGYNVTADGTYHAVLWNTDRGITDLGTLPGGSSSFTGGINNLGQVVGSGSTADGAYHAFLWTEGVGMMDLGTLLGGTESFAAGINDFGQVVGYSSTANGTNHAFLWTQENGMTDLGTLPGGSDSIALGINNLGQIVGASNSITGGGAVLWTTNTAPPLPQEQTQQMITNVQSMIDTGSLNRGQGDALIAMLNAATEQLNRGNTKASNLLQAFINGVQAYTKAGILSIVQGKTLIDAANGLIAQLK